MAKPRRPGRLAPYAAAAAVVVVVAVGTVAFAPPARAEPSCPRFDLFVGAGVPAAIVSDVRGRLAASDLMSNGDLADCPVRLSAVGGNLVVDVELEDGIVSRTFAIDPPGEAAWSVARVLQGLSSRPEPAPRAAPPDEMIPGVLFPGRREPAPPPRAERPAPSPVTLAVGAAVHADLEGDAAPASLSLQVAPRLPFFPDWLRPTLLGEGYVPSPSALQFAAGLVAEPALSQRLRLSLTLAVVPTRYQDDEWLAPGATVSCRLEDTFTPWLAIGPRVTATWLSEPAADIAAGLDIMLRP